MDDGDVGDVGERRRPSTTAGEVDVVDDVDHSLCSYNAVTQSRLSEVESRI